VPPEIDMFLRYRKSGILPHSGGWHEQLNYVVEVIDIIEAEFNRVEGGK